MKRPPPKNTPEEFLDTVTDSLHAARAASRVIRRLRAKSAPEALLDTVSDSLAGVRGGVKAKLNRKVLYELDGGDRKKVNSFTITVQPAAITICLPMGKWGHSGNGAT